MSEPATGLPDMLLPGMLPARNKSPDSLTENLSKKEKNMTHKHAITHIEFSTRNLEETKKFYSSVFEWDIKDFPEMNYATFSAEGGTGGGFNPISDNIRQGR